MELGRTNGLDPYAGYVVDDSDLEYSECSDNDSSEDELGNLEATRRQIKTNCSVVQEDGDDEFEQEMNNEADRLLEIAMGGQDFVKGPELTLDPRRHQSLEDPDKDLHVEVKKDATVEEECDSKYYDEIYFDSSDEEINKESVKGKKSGGRKILKLTNDELFYDPNMDDEDEKWVERQRQSYHNSTPKNPKSGKPSEKVTDTKPADGATPTHNEATPPNKASHSDAILNCPACMTTLCLDCQRHDLYYNQFRAIYVLNCKIIKDEVLKYCPKDAKRKRKKCDQSTIASSKEEDVYRPVRCNICDTEVAVCDNEEIFHFFNVIAGAP